MHDIVGVVKAWNNRKEQKQVEHRPTIIQRWYMILHFHVFICSCHVYFGMQTQVKAGSQYDAMLTQRDATRRRIRN